MNKYDKAACVIAQLDCKHYYNRSIEIPALEDKIHFQKLAAMRHARMAKYLKKILNRKPNEISYV